MSDWSATSILWGLFEYARAAWILREFIIAETVNRRYIVIDAGQLHLFRLPPPQTRLRPTPPRNRPGTRRLSLLQTSALLAPSLPALKISPAIAAALTMVVLAQS